MEKIIKNQSGVTLIEALIAMLVLAVGILAVNAMHISSTRGNVSANKLTIAGATGETIYEALTSQSYSGTVFDAGNHNISELTGFVLPGSVSTATWRVTQWSNSDGVDNDGDGTPDEDDENNIKFVVLTITYTDDTVKNLSISFLKSEIY